MGGFDLVFAGIATLVATFVIFVLSLPIFVLN